MTPAVLAAAALALAGCGGDDGASTEPPAASPEVDRSAPSPIASGTTTLDLGQRVELLLGAAGVEIVPIGGAREAGEGIEIPVSGGELGVDPLAGRLRHDGGIRLSAAGRTVEARGLRLDLESGDVSAEVGGVRLPLLSAELAAPEVSPDSSAVVLEPRTVTLSDEAVAPINQALGIDLLSGGLSVGELGVRARWR